MKVYNTLILLCIGLFGLSTISNGQEVSVGSFKHQSYIKSYVTTGLEIVKQPFTWKGEDWVAPAGAILLTGITLTVDEPLANLLHNWDDNAASSFGKWGNTLGGFEVQLGISGASMAIGALSKNDAWLHFGTDNLQAQAFAGGFAFIVKELSHRARPNNAQGAYDWYGPFNGSGKTSFYSGHTTLAFATATMIYLHSNKKWWVGLLSYTAATGVGVSRMQQEKHWASDVVAGAIMGSVISTFVYQQQEKRRHNNAMHKQLKIIP